MIVLESIERLPDSFELSSYTGRKANGMIKLLPIRNDRSLVQIGLIEVSIRPMNSFDYNVQYIFNLSEIDSVSDLLVSGKEKASLLISNLEDSVELN